MESLTLYPAYEGFDTGLVQHVDMKKWAASTAEKPLVATHGLGPCIGIAVYNTKSRLGLVGHFANAAMEAEELWAMFTHAITSGSKPEDLQVYVRGGQESRRTQEEIQAGKLVIDTGALNKEVVASVLTEFQIDPNNTNVEYDKRFWDDPGQEGCTRILLDTTTGTFHEWRKETGAVIEKVGALGIAGGSEAASQ